jgi:hypothetical protein
VAELAVDPVVADPAAAAGQLQEEGPHQTDVLLGRQLAEVRSLADVPQAEQVRAVLEPRGQVIVGGQRPQGGLIQRLGGQLQALAVGQFRQRLQERRQGREVELGVAPLGRRHGFEGVVLDRLHQVGVHVLSLAGDAEGPVLLVAARAPGDLAGLLR